ncbi:MAG: VCBS repeat-containing protein [Cyclobacteriaceae bacterium]|nr:VCBS repeat-containing protein [Cyclobacteriaceae bacterium]
MRNLCLLLITFNFFLSCNLPSDREKLFEAIPSRHSNVDFSNIINTNDTFNALNFDYIYNGGGVAVGDINNDGLPDLFFSGNMVSSKLYLNKGNFVFEDITESAGVSTHVWITGVSMVDINHDGFTDMYLCVASKDSTLSKNLLFINNGDNTFTESAAQYGLDDAGYSTHAAFFDYDGDGDLDVYVLTNAYVSSNRNVVRQKKTDGESVSTDRLYRNNGDGTFTNVSREAGILIEGYGLGVAIADINRDGWPDIYVANDFITNDLLWINNQDGTFTDKASEYLKHQSFNGMGVDIADFNNDGLVDIVVMDMLPPDNLRQKTMFPDINYNQFRMILSLGYTPQYVRNTLQLNNGNNTFSEIGLMAGIHETDWSWAPLFADFDNSGFKDLFITNGYRKDVTNLDFISYNMEQKVFGTEEAKHEEAMRQLAKLQGAHIHNYMFKNPGSLIFEDVSHDWGFGEATYSNGAAFADLDNDGDLDLIINNIDLEASLFKNHSDKLSENNYLQIRLLGSDKNTMALGSQVTLQTGNTKQFYEHYIHRGYKSTVSDVIHFGLGKTNVVDHLMVVWPDGKVTEINGVNANQRIEISYQDASEKSIDENELDETTGDQLFKRHSLSGLDYKHQVINYADFYDQFLLPHKFSRNGPGIAVGDINGDGLEDFYIGGAAGFPGTFFIRNQNGFEQRSHDLHIENEDLGVLLFDANGNGFPDLYVVSGGNSYHKSEKEKFRDRLYFNDGSGKFTWQPEALPDIFTSGSKVTAADFDGDGDLDLFVGGRIIPGEYPLPARSYILRNNNGVFEDVSEQVLPQLKQLGLVTDAIWTDFDQDGKIDLIVVGEWMPVTFFKNENGIFKNVTGNSGTGHLKGWWNSIAAGDFNKDGKMDYIVGNLGLNTKLKADAKMPLRMYADDFDQNGSIDPIMSRYIQGREHVIHPRDNLIKQIASMKRRFPKYHIYGESDISTTLTKDEIRNSYSLEANFMESAYLENLGNGMFSLKALPEEAQIAPVFGLLVRDFDGDGNPDVLIAGNSYATEIHSGWYDAGKGLLLRGDGKGNFDPVHHSQSGFFADTDAKGMAELQVDEFTGLILVASNEDSLATFMINYDGGERVFNPKPDDYKANLYYDHHRFSVVEFQYGSGYLSHSSRYFRVPKEVVNIEMVNYKGDKRIIR